VIIIENVKKAKKYIGRKVLFKIAFDGEVYFEEKENIVTSMEKLIEAKDKGTYYGRYFTDVELLEDNIELYKCSYTRVSALEDLYRIREAWNKGIFNYCEYLTKEEIIKFANLIQINTIYFLRNGGQNADN